MILVFDTETTGKADFKQPPEHPSQPRLVQLGAILFDSAGIVRAEANLIVKPDGFEISEEVAKIHGISQEIALKYGMNEKAVLLLFIGMMAKAEVLVAHNIQYDGIVMGRAYSVHALETKPPKPYCTMKQMTDICKLPGPYGFKWPTLQEAHKHCFGEEFVGAHDAMADVRACARVYHWLKAKNKGEQ